MTFFECLQPTGIPLSDTCVFDNIELLVESGGPCSLKCPSESSVGHFLVVSPNAEEGTKEIEKEKSLFNIDFDVCKQIGFSLPDGFCTNLVKASQFTAALDSSVIGPVSLGGGALRNEYRWVAFIGAGKSADFHSGATMKKIGRKVWCLAKEHSLQHVVVHVMNHQSLSSNDLATFTQAFFLNMIPRDQFKSKRDTEPLKLKRVVICVEKGVPNAARVVADNKLISKAKIAACDLGDAPPNYCTCITLNDFANKVATENHLEVRTLDETQCASKKMGCLLGVSQGSRFGAKLIHLVYKSADFQITSDKRVALVGKGITMDTGGYNLKVVGNSISYMKTDMCGAAAVIACADVVAKLAPKHIEVHFVVPTCENMISSDAYRPGDIITSMKGLTVEIGNTDAEGRLALVDAITYIQEELKSAHPPTTANPIELIDIATLTGAQVVALGPDFAGVVSNHESMSKNVCSSFNAQHEAAWPLPYHKPYGEWLVSKNADLNNIGGAGKAGSIVGGMFIDRFVDPETHWAHVDIAAPSYDDSTCKCTGFGVAGFTEYILRRAGDERAKSD